MSRELRKPDEPPEEEPREVEPEIVGMEEPPRPRRPAWRAFLARLSFVLVLGVAGVLVSLLGLALTLSVVGAVFGLPLLLVGLFLIVLALTLPLTRR